MKIIAWNQDRDQLSVVPEGQTPPLGRAVYGRLYDEADPPFIVLNQDSTDQPIMPNHVVELAQRDLGLTIDPQDIGFEQNGEMLEPRTASNQYIDHALESYLGTRGSREQDLDAIRQRMMEFYQENHDLMSNMQPNQFSDAFRITDQGAPTGFWLNKSANVLDPIHETLDQDVFNGTQPKLEFFNYHLHHMREVFRQYGFHPAAFEFFLTGSLCTYQYNDLSDVDITIVCITENFNDEDRSELVSIVVNHLDGEHFPGTKHPYQHYVQPAGVDVHDLFAIGVKGAYDFQDDKWERRPDRLKAIDMEETHPDWIAEAILTSDKLNSLISGNYDYEAIDMFNQIHKKRAEETKTVGNENLSEIIYKYLENNGTFDRLRNFGVRIAHASVPEGNWHFRNGKLCNCGFGRPNPDALALYYGFLPENGKISGWKRYAATKEEMLQYIRENDLRPGSKWDRKNPGGDAAVWEGLQRVPEGVGAPMMRWLANASKKWYTEKYQTCLAQGKRVERTLFGVNPNRARAVWSELKQDWDEWEQELGEHVVPDSTQYEDNNPELKNTFVHQIADALGFQGMPKSFVNGKDPKEWFDFRDTILSRGFAQKYGTLLQNLLKEWYGNGGETPGAWRIKQFTDDVPEGPADVVAEHLASRSITYGVSQMGHSLWGAKELADRYNIKVPMNEWKSVEDAQDWVEQVQEETKAKEEYKELLTNFKNGPGWDSDPVATFDRKDGQWAIYPVNYDEAEMEGELMDHCLGSEEQPHLEGIARGAIHAYSVRDPNGIPWATMTFNPDGKIYACYGRHDHAVRDSESDMLAEWIKNQFGEHHSFFNRYDLDEEDKNPEERSVGRGGAITGDWNDTPEFNNYSEEDMDEDGEMIEHDPVPIDADNPIAEQYGNPPDVKDLGDLESLFNWVDEMNTRNNRWIWDTFKNHGFAGWDDEEIQEDEDNDGRMQPYFYVYPDLDWNHDSSGVTKELLAYANEANVHDIEARGYLAEMARDYLIFIGLVRVYGFSNDLPNLEKQLDQSRQPGAKYLRLALNEVNTYGDWEDVANVNVGAIQNEADSDFGYNEEESYPPAYEKGWHPEEKIESGQPLSPENWQHFQNQLENQPATIPPTTNTGEGMQGQLFSPTYRFNEDNQGPVWHQRESPLNPSFMDWRQEALENANLTPEQQEILEKSKPESFRGYDDAREQIGEKVQREQEMAAHPWRQSFPPQSEQPTLPIGTDKPQEVWDQELQWHHPFKLLPGESPYKHSNIWKIAMWIPGYHSAVMYQDLKTGEHLFKHGPSPEWGHYNTLGLLDKEHNLFPDQNDKFMADYWRGLYNPETQHLLHMAEPKNMGYMSGEDKVPLNVNRGEAAGVDQINDVFRPDQLKTWQQAAAKAGVPVSKAQFAAFQNPDELGYTNDVVYIDPSQIQIPGQQKGWSMRNHENQFGWHNPEAEDPSILQEQKQQGWKQEHPEYFRHSTWHQPGENWHFNDAGQPCNCGFGRPDPQAVMAMAKRASGWRVYAATKDEVFNSLFKQDLKPGSKFDQRNPGFYEGLKEALADVPESAAYALKWVVNTAKKDWLAIVQSGKIQKAEQQAKNELYGKKNPELMKHLYDELEKEGITNHRFLNDQVTNSGFDSADIENAIFEMVGVDRDTLRRAYDMPNYGMDKLREEYGYPLAGLAGSRGAPKRNLYNFMYYLNDKMRPEYVAENEMEKIFPNAYTAAFLMGSVKELADRYNIPAPFNQLSHLVDGINWALQVRTDTGEREESKKREERLRDWDRRRVNDVSAPVADFKTETGTWTINPVTEDEAQEEGDLMSHCFGSESQPHIHGIRKGKINAYSVRDPKGLPWATITFNSKTNQVLECYGQKDHMIRPSEQKMLEEWIAKEFGMENNYFNKEEGGRSGTYLGTPPYNGYGYEDEDDRELRIENENLTRRIRENLENLARENHISPNNQVWMDWLDDIVSQPPGCGMERWNEILRTSDFEEEARIFLVSSLVQNAQRRLEQRQRNEQQAEQILTDNIRELERLEQTQPNQQAEDQLQQAEDIEQAIDWAESELLGTFEAIADTYEIENNTRWQRWVDETLATRNEVTPEAWLRILRDGQWLQRGENAARAITQAGLGQQNPPENNGVQPGHVPLTDRFGPEQDPQEWHPLRGHLGEPRPAKVTWKLSAFDGLEVDARNGTMRVRDSRTGEVVGSIIWHNQPEGGTFVEYLGYGEMLHPNKDAARIAELKQQYPKVGIDLMRWARANLNPPFFGAFANQKLRETLKAEPTGQSFQISPEEATALGENRTEIPIDRIPTERFRRSSWRLAQNYKEQTLGNLEYIMENYESASLEGRKQIKDLLKTLNHKQLMGEIFAPGKPLWRTENNIKSYWTLVSSNNPHALEISEQLRQSIDLDLYKIYQTVRDSEEPNRHHEVLKKYPADWTFKSSEWRQSARQSPNIDQEDLEMQEPNPNQAGTDSTVTPDSDDEQWINGPSEEAWMSAPTTDHESSWKQSMPIHNWSEDTGPRPEKLYHAAPSKHRENIQRSGLKPPKEDWVETPWKGTYEYEDPNEIGVYAYNDPNQAEEYLHGVPGGPQNFDLWEIDPERPDFYTIDDEDYGSELQSPHEVRPENLKLHKQDIPQLPWEDRSLNFGAWKQSSTDLVGELRSFLQEDAAASKAFETLSPHGEVYAVGGAPRDILLGKAPKDIDLMARIDPETIEKALKQVPGGKLNFAGKNFGVFHFSYGGDMVEIALPRTEASTGVGHKDFDVKADHTLPVEADLPRRDFTANSIAVDLKNGRVVDPLGGAQDLARGVLRHTNPNAFKDDPLRTVRALTMHSRHGLTPTPETAQAISQYAHLVSELPGERIQAELDKILQGNYPSDAIIMGHRLGVLQHFLPEVSQTFGFDQENKHHQHDLGSHLMEVLKGTANRTDDVDLRLAALLHDIGKPASKWMDPETGGAHYYRGPHGEGANHAEVGAQMAEQAMRRLNYPSDKINKVTQLVGAHMFAPFNTGRGARKFLNQVGSPEMGQDLLTLRAADHEGKGGTHGTSDFMVNNMRKLINEQTEAPAFSTKNLAISGNDVMNVLGVKPGPEVGQALQALLEQIIDNPALNTREDLLGLLKGIKNG